MNDEKNPTHMEIRFFVDEKQSNQVCLALAYCW